MGRKRIWTQQKVIEGIRHRHQAGCDLTLSRALAADPRLVQAAVRCCGGWRQAMKAAGLDYEHVLTVGKQHRSYAITKWTREAVLAELHGAWKLGEDIRASAVLVRLPGLYRAASRMFASWADVLTAAGISPNATLESARLHARWKRQWLCGLRRQATGSARPIARPRDYRRAFRMTTPAPTADWLRGLTARAGK